MSQRLSPNAGWPLLALALVGCGADTAKAPPPPDPAATAAASKLAAEQEAAYQKARAKMLKNPAPAPPADGPDPVTGQPRGQ